MFSSSVGKMIKTGVRLATAYKCFIFCRVCINKMDHLSLKYTCKTNLKFTLFTKYQHPSLRMLVPRRCYLPQMIDRNPSIIHGLLAYVYATTHISRHLYDDSVYGKCKHIYLILYLNIYQCGITMDQRCNTIALFRI